MELSTNIVQIQKPSGGSYEETTMSSLVLYNPLRDVELPTLPPGWIQVHQSAVSTSIAAGAATYALSKLTGQCLTYTITLGIRVTGSVFSEGARIVSGEESARSVQAHANTVSNVFQQVGDTCTNVTSLVTSSAVAAVVGATALFGSMCRNIYGSFQKPAMEQVSDSFEYDFVVCDIRPIPPVQTSEDE